MNEINRRDFLVASGLMTVAVSAIGGEPISIPKEPQKSLIPKVVHHVFFWLKSPESKEDRAKLIAGIKSLAAIETVKAIHVGVPASTEKRDVVDNSYHVSEILCFENVEGQNIYQAHAIHQKFIDEHSHLWSKVVVYDTVAA